MSKGRALALSAGIVTIATLSGRIFGFVREVVIANKFGAGAETDAFIVAFTIPNIIYSLVVMGALSASFIPVFSGLLANDDEEEAWRLAHTILNLLLIAFGFIAAALMVFAPQVIFLVSPGFGSSGEQLALASNLLRIMAPALIFLGISGLMAGTLNSYNHFATPSLVALVQNVIMVAAIIFLAQRMGIYAAAIGFLAASVCQVLIQLPALLKRKLSYRAVLDLRSERAKSVAKLFLPVLVALAASQSNLIVDKWFASFLETGSISYLNYAFKVGSLPLNTLVAAIAIVLFPTLSRQAATRDTDALRDTISLGVRIIAMVAVPASVGLFVLSKPIIGLLFEHGAFGSAATVATAAALAAYSFGLVAMGLNMLLVRSFYALHDGMTPLKASLVFIVFLIALDIVLVRPFAHVGLALSYTIAVSVMALVMLGALRKRLQGLDEAKLIVSFAKTFLAAVVMGVGAWFTASYLSATLAGGTKLTELTVVVIAISVGALLYLGALVLARAEEIAIIRRLIRGKISAKQVAADDV
ncbi:MAG TPA: murein biosynthesis integral membrane protein MurJ [Actinobacteria bacterium]|nr:murein biosynthesis integral membrane protein MurJ [Actinomycetota bacterium]